MSAVVTPEERISELEEKVARLATDAEHARAERMLQVQGTVLIGNEALKLRDAVNGIRGTVSLLVVIGASLGVGYYLLGRWNESLEERVQKLAKLAQRMSSN